MKTFYTHYVRPEHFKNEPYKPSKVNRTGVIPLRMQIQNFILAGARLRRVREETFDFPEGTEADIDYIDPTRLKGFDLADAGAIKLAAQQRLAAQSKANLRKAQADAQAARLAALEAEKTPPTDGLKLESDKKKVEQV